MIHFKVLGSGNAARIFKRAAGTFEDTIVDAVEEGMVKVESDAKANAKYRVLGRNSRGHLASNIFTYVKNVPKSHVEGVVAVDIKRVPYARIHELGGTIKPVKKRWLTIPIAGTKGRARDFSNTFFFVSKKSNLILAQNTGGGIKPLFVLKKQVKIPKRPYLRPALLGNVRHIQNLTNKKLNSWAKNL